MSHVEFYKYFSVFIKHLIQRYFVICIPRERPEDIFEQSILLGYDKTINHSHKVEVTFVHLE